MTLKELIQKLKDKLDHFIEKHIVEIVDDTKDYESAVACAIELPQPSLASCWEGANATQRMMNIGSPKMPESTAKAYIDKMVKRGCNTAHVFITNAGDGEFAGYDGRKKEDAKIILQRMNLCRAAGLYVVPWLMADDSGKLDKDILSNAQKSADAFAANGLLDNTSLIVLGLEMDEYGNKAQFESIRDAIIDNGYKGEFGTHHTSGKYTFASLGKYVFDQLDPKEATESKIKSSVKSLINKGYKVIGFEYARGPAQKLAQAALDAGAVGVGNWEKKTVVTVEEIATSSEKEQVQSVDEVEFSALDFCWGSFAGGKAALGSGRIQKLKIGSNLSYGVASTWFKDLGCNVKSDASALACLFCYIDGKWAGGKFDWISESRTTRDFKNIEEGYNGWRKDAIKAAKKYAFVIVSKDGKRRTNVICA